jgi:serine/threonine-protein kinase HipA
MGALVYHPARGPGASADDIDVARLVELAEAVLKERQGLDADVAHDQRAMDQVLQVGTSAGGARAKAVIAWNPKTRVIRSGQGGLEPGFSHWILKLDGVRSTDEREGGTTLGFGLVEYAYHLMAVRAGIQMTRSEVLPEGGRHHFMTRRFDRTPKGAKLHMQSLAALRHFDFNAAGAYSYEQAIEAMRGLALSQVEIEQQFRRTVFNIVSRNQDDHVKNIAFLMNQRGEWSLSPAFDVTYSYNPSGRWTSQHQMTVNEKRDAFMIDDLLDFAGFCNLKVTRGKEIVEKVVQAVRQWPAIAKKVGIPTRTWKEIGRHHRLDLSPAVRS